MQSNVAYINIVQALTDFSAESVRDKSGLQNTPHKINKQVPLPSIADLSRDLVVNISRNNVHGGNRNISHVTWEFAGPRARFFSCAIFDGTGDSGTSADKFAMPGQKIGLRQKAIILLTLMKYSIDNGLISQCEEKDVSWEFISNKISQEFDGGVEDIVGVVNRMTKVSINIAQSILRGDKVINATESL